MTKTTHLISGFCLGTALFKYGDYSIYTSSIIVFASILPDIDVLIFGMDNNRNGLHNPHNFKWGLFKHRGITHTFLFLGLLLYLIQFFNLSYLLIPVFLGFTLHLFLDGFNFSEIKPFWPLPLGIELKLIKVGTFKEFAFADIPMIMGLFFLFKGVNIHGL